MGGSSAGAEDLNKACHLGKKKLLTTLPVQPQGSSRIHDVVGIKMFFQRS